MKSSTFSQNKDNSFKALRTKLRKGFSIVEVAIAMGVVTLLLTTFLGVFGPAQKNLNRALSTKDANRMKDTLMQEMSILRSTDSDISSFAKAFRMIKDSHAPATAVIMYQYRADPTADNDNDGILDAYAVSGGIQGKDYIIQTAVRALGSSSTIADELEAVDGPVFLVRMTQLIQYPGSNVMEPVPITDPQKIYHLVVNEATGDSEVSEVSESRDYSQAVIAFRAEFFKLNVNKFSYVSGGSWSFENVGNAITEVNMAVRR